MYLAFAVHIGSTEFQIMGTFGDNGKLYLHAGDIAKILGEDAVDGWVEDNGHVKFGDITSHCDNIMRKTWSMELGGLINFLANMKPVYGSDLYYILENDKVAKYQKPVTSTPEIVARNICQLTVSDLRWSRALLTRLMMVNGKARKHKPTAPIITDLPPHIINDDLFMKPELLSSPPDTSKPPPVQFSELRNLFTSPSSPADQQQQQEFPSGSTATQPNDLLTFSNDPFLSSTALIPPASCFAGPSYSPPQPNFLQHLLMVPELSSSALLIPSPTVSPFVTTPPLCNKFSQPNILRK